MAIGPARRTLLLWKRGRERDYLARNKEIVLLMSDVIGSMKPSDLVSLTIEVDGRVITPQESFVDFFGRYNLSTIDVTQFKREFLGAYYLWGPSWIGEMEYLGSRNREVINDLWEKFRGAIPALWRRREERICPLRGYRILLLLRIQDLRRLGRLLFGSFGCH